MLRELLSGRDCEIGAHHHAWETPPCTDDDVRRHPYALQLPRRSSPRRWPRSPTPSPTPSANGRCRYRSGRFGFSAAHVSDLERAGYTVESSVAPLFYEGHKGGPDFVGRAARAVLPRLRRSRPCPGTSNLLELPVSAALNRRVPAFVERLYGAGAEPYTTKRILRKLGVARVQWLRPSYSSVDDMCALARRMKADGVPLLNLIFHSSEAIVGGSPYNRTAEELEQFFARLERVLAFAVNDLGADPGDVLRVQGALSRQRSATRRLRTGRRMRICHVTSHLPPDQAANALLPLHLGQWAVEAGDSPSLRRAPAPGAERRAVGRAPRRSSRRCPAR